MAKNDELLLGLVGTVLMVVIGIQSARYFLDGKMISGWFFFVFAVILGCLGVYTLIKLGEKNDG